MKAAETLQWQNGAAAALETMIEGYSSLRVADQRHCKGVYDSSWAESPRYAGRYP